MASQMGMKWKAAWVLGFLALAGCESKPKVWIYTSLYKEVIAQMEPMVRKALPDVEVQWFQGGSENVAAKLNAELAGGHPQADLVLTSDPFWTLELKKTGHLLAYESPAVTGLPAVWRDPDHAFTMVRIPVMVLGVNPKVAAADRPLGWKDLAAKSALKGKVSMGSPLESGTSFTTVAALARNQGWDYFDRLRAQEMLAAGGNSSVITRMETGERPVGIVLLENLLKARAKGSPIEILYPEEGAIPVPSPIAILKASKQPEAARRIYDWFFTREAQEAIVAGGMYPVLPGVAEPVGAKPWKELQAKAYDWSTGELARVLGERDSIKTRFSEKVLR